jgi:prolyl-tRNA editing enzyme YbaK/EbsC (Cys-tRNA(Pro) deacylase)
LDVLSTLPGDSDASLTMTTVDEYYDVETSKRYYSVGGARSRRVLDRRRVTGTDGRSEGFNTDAGEVSPMHPRAAEFAALARERYGFDPDVREFPEGTRTAADAAAAIGCDVAAIASSLVFRVVGPDGAGADAGGDDGDRVVVAVTSGANRVDEARLAAHLGVEAVETADAEGVRDATGWAIGGVPPFAHERDPRVLLDPTLAEREEVWAAAGTPAAVFPVAPDRLREFADAAVVDVTERDD